MMNCESIHTIWQKLWRLYRKESNMWIKGIRIFYTPLKKYPWFLAQQVCGWAAYFDRHAAVAFAADATDWLELRQTVVAPPICVGDEVDAFAGEYRLSTGTTVTVRGPVRIPASAVVLRTQFEAVVGDAVLPRCWSTIIACVVVGLPNRAIVPIPDAPPTPKLCNNRNYSAGAGEAKRANVCRR